MNILLNNYLKLFNIFLPFLIHTNAWSGNEFNLDRDFPNYFKQTSHSSTEITAALTEAMSSVIDRLGIPYYDEEEKKIVRSGFFDRLKTQIKGQDPEAKIYVSGGVVRSLLGYLYQKIDRMKQMHPGPEKDVFDLLNEITHENRNRKNQKPLEPSLALGVGSDLDILIALSHEGQEKAFSIQQSAKDLIHSARKELKLERNQQEGILNSIIPYGDVNFYHAQIARSIRNGGSTLDYLAFDLKSHEIKEPEQEFQIIPQFLEGKLDCIPGTQREDFDTTTVRVLRALLEIPFLKPTENCREQLKRELTALIQKVSSRVSLNEKTMAQFEKMARNARFGGAHNRFYESQDEIDKLARQLILAIGKFSPKNLYVVPQFLYQSDPKTRKVKPLPSEVLIDFDKFQSEFTNGGIVFHGTPHFSNFLNMIRNGPVLSSKVQGAAASGSGAYTTPEYSTAKTYSGVDHTIIPIDFKEKKHLRIIEWNEAMKNEAFRMIADQISTGGQDPHQVLAREYGVDIICQKIDNGYIVLIENASILRLPKKMGDLIRPQAQRLEREILNLKFDDLKNTSPPYDELESYQLIYQLSNSLKYKNLISLSDIFKNAFEQKRPEWTKTLHGLTDSSGVAYQELLKKALTDPDPDIRFLGALALKVIDIPDQKILFEIALNDPLPEIATMGAYSLYNYRDSNTAFEVLKNVLTHPKTTVKVAARYGLTQYSGERAEELFLLTAKQGPVDPMWERDRIPMPANIPFITSYQALGNYRGRDQADIIEKFLRSNDPQLNKIAATSFIYFTGEQQPRLLKLALSHPNPDIRRDAAYGLSRIKNSQEAYFLFEMALNDSSPMVVENSVRQLKYSLTHSDKDFNSLFAKTVQVLDPESFHLIFGILDDYHGNSLPELLPLVLDKIESEIFYGSLIFFLENYTGSDKDKIIQKLIPHKKLKSEDRERLSRSLLGNSCF